MQLFLLVFSGSCLALLLAAELEEKFALRIVEPAFDLALDQPDLAALDTLALRSRSGQPFVCYLPPSPTHPQFNRPTHLNITTKQVEEKLQFEDGCSYANKGWWTYELCFGSELLQYHVEKAAGGVDPTTTISLGQFSHQTNWDNFTVDAHTRRPPPRLHHTQWYTNGTACDLTGGLRETEVNFFCSSKWQVSIAEPFTCKYQVTVNTPTLCDIPLFQSEDTIRPTEIKCHIKLPSPLPPPVKPRTNKLAREKVLVDEEDTASEESPELTGYDNFEEIEPVDDVPSAALYDTDGENLPGEAEPADEGVVVEDGEVFNMFSGHVTPLEEQPHAGGEAGDAHVQFNGQDPIEFVVEAEDMREAVDGNFGDIEVEASVFYKDPKTGSLVENKVKVVEEPRKSHFGEAVEVPLRNIPVDENRPVTPEEWKTFAEQMVVEGEALMSGVELDEVDTEVVVGVLGGIVRELGEFPRHVMHLVVSSESLLLPRLTEVSQSLARAQLGAQDAKDEGSKERLRQAEHYSRAALRELKREAVSLIFVVNAVLRFSRGSETAVHPVLQQYTDYDLSRELVQIAGRGDFNTRYPLLQEWRVAAQFVIGSNAILVEELTDIEQSFLLFTQGEHAQEEYGRRLLEVGREERRYTSFLNGARHLTRRLVAHFVSTYGTADLAFTPRPPQPPRSSRSNQPAGSTVAATEMERYKRAMLGDQLYYRERMAEKAAALQPPNQPNQDSEIKFVIKTLTGKDGKLLTQQFSVKSRDLGLEHQLRQLVPDSVDIDNDQLEVHVFNVDGEPLEGDFLSDNLEELQALLMKALAQTVGETLQQVNPSSGPYLQAYHEMNSQYYSSVVDSEPVVNPKSYSRNYNLI